VIATQPGEKGPLERPTDEGYVEVMAKCAHCGQSIETPKSDEEAAAQHKVRPFCSKRCQLADLSKWLGEEHRIAGESVTVEDELDDE
jgi:uncharacterized protein